MSVVSTWIELLWQLQRFSRVIFIKLFVQSIAFSILPFECITHILTDTCNDTPPRPPPPPPFSFLHTPILFWCMQVRKVKLWIEIPVANYTSSFARKIHYLLAISFILCFTLMIFIEWIGYDRYGQYKTVVVLYVYGLMAYSDQLYLLPSNFFVNNIHFQAKFNTCV